MNKKQVIANYLMFMAYEASQFDIQDAVIISGSAMVMLGVKDEVHCIDIRCSKEMFDYFAATNCQRHFVGKSNGLEVIACNASINLYLCENQLAQHVEHVEHGVTYASAQNTLAYKKNLNREKDQVDIAILEEFIANELFLKNYDEKLGPVPGVRAPAGAITRKQAAAFSSPITSAYQKPE